MILENLVLCVMARLRYTCIYCVSHTMAPHPPHCSHSMHCFAAPKASNMSSYNDLMTGVGGSLVTAFVYELELTEAPPGVPRKHCCWVGSVVDILLKMCMVLLPLAVGVVM